MIETNLGNDNDMRKQKRRTQSEKDDIVYSSFFIASDNKSTTKSLNN